MLTLQALFTAVLAWRLYGESMDRRVGSAAVALLLAGGIALVLDQSQSGSSQLWGLIAVMGATAAWGLDNTLSRALAERDPGQVVMAKAVLGVAATLVLAWLTDEPVPAALPALGLLAGPGGKRLWPEPALIPACAARFRGYPHGVGVCLCPVHRCGSSAPVGGSLRRLGHAAGWPTDVAGGGYSLDRVTLP